MDDDPRAPLRIDPVSGDPRVPVDDPTGGSGLSRRLAIALPIAALIGLVVGVPLAVASGQWRIVIPCALAPVVVVGTLLAILEDGRVQRRVDRTRGR